jgi:hypothetical protein
VLRPEGRHHRLGCHRRDLHGRSRHWGRRRSSCAFTRGAFQGCTHASIRRVAFLLGDDVLSLGIGGVGQSGGVSDLGLALAVLDGIILLWDSKDSMPEVIAAMEQRQEKARWSSVEELRAGSGSGRKKN